MYLVDIYLKAEEVLSKMGVVQKIMREGEESWYYRLLSLYKQKKTFHPARVIVNILKHYSKEHNISFDILKEVFCERFPKLCKLCKLEKVEELEKILAEKVEREEEWEVVDVEDVVKRKI